MALGTGQSLYSQYIGEGRTLHKWKQEGWKRGENVFSEDNEIRDDELYSLINGEITGKSSIRLPRRGRRLFAQIAGGVNFNGGGIYKDPVTRSSFMVAMVDGRLYKITTGGTVTEIDGTKSWDTTAKMRGVLLRGWYYFGNAADYMSKTDGDNVVQWVDVTLPTLNSAVLTGSGSEAIHSYAITAVTDNGETEGSNEIDVWGPAALDETTNKITLTIARKTDAAVKGYNIYKSYKGSTFTQVTFVDQPAAGPTLTWVDDGTLERSLIYELPSFNTTGGVKGSIFAKYANTLFVSGNDQEPDTVFYGGTGSNWESFSPSDNGGWIKPGRGDGERVTAMIGFEDFLFIFKENSIWKFMFGSDGGPVLISMVPQYGTSSPDTVWRMEGDVIFFGTDGRLRILGYEPTQLNVIRTADIGNREQPRYDAIDKSDPELMHGIFYEQKFILCDGANSYPYDRRYIGFLGKWTNQNFTHMMSWDKSTGQQLLFGFQSGTGKIYQLLVDGTYDDDGSSIEALARFKRVDGGADDLIKTFMTTTTKFKNPKGRIKFITYKDGETTPDETSISFGTSGGIGEFMFGEFMFGESATIESVSDAFMQLTKELYSEAMSIYHQVEVTGNSNNHCIVQTMSGYFETEDPDYRDSNRLII